MRPSECAHEVGFVSAKVGGERAGGMEGRGRRIFGGAYIVRPSAHSTGQARAEKTREKRRRRNREGMGKALRMERRRRALFQELRPAW